MGAGKRKRAQQDSLLTIPIASLARSASHDFYEHVNRVSSATASMTTSRCARPPLWKARRSPAAVPGLRPVGAQPGHATLSRTRQCYPVGVHDEVITRILGVPAKAGLLKDEMVAAMPRRCRPERLGR